MAKELSEDFQEGRDAGYTDGRRSAYIGLLEQAARELGYDDLISNAASVIAERERAIQTLREICATHGDNDWPDDLHLADIIEKHLVRHLDHS